MINFLFQSYGYTLAVIIFSLNERVLFIAGVISRFYDYFAHCNNTLYGIFFYDTIFNDNKCGMEIFMTSSSVLF